MQILVGLGNPGPEYAQTRHNVGFLVLDELALRLKLTFQHDKNAEALVAKSSELVLIKPQTFMNDSGRSVRSWISYYEKQLLSDSFPQLGVIYDDLDIPLGSWKWQFGSGPKAHNGVNSIVAHLKTDQFWHGRVGTENREQHRVSIPSAEYVLQPFFGDEQQQIKDVITALADHVLDASHWRK